MQARVWCMTLAALAGCGRLRFGGQGDPDALGDDGPPGDGAPGDGASPDAAFACQPAFQICDGFEAGSFDPVWSHTSGVTIDSTVAHRGTSSVHIHSTPVSVGQDADFQLEQSTTLPLGDPVFYVRAYARFGSLPANNMGLIEAQQPASQNEVAVFLYDDAIGVYTQFVEHSRKTMTAPPTNTWLCLVWRVARSASAGSLQLSGDVPSVVIADQTDGMPPIRDMFFGIAFAGPSVTVPQPAMDIWFDDIIVSPQPVTCAD